MADIRDLTSPPRRGRRLRGPEELPRTHWRVSSDPIWNRARGKRRIDGVQVWLLTLLSGAAIGLASTFVDVPRPSHAAPAATGTATMPATMSRTFGFCHSGGGTNCVVDGDTFWLDGVRIRIADIDTPETHPARCASEAELGAQATRRLQALLNTGPVVLASVDRDEDRYRRKLRIVMRDGQSLGDMLVAEGLARRWTGQRQPWCAV